MSKETIFIIEARLMNDLDFAKMCLLELYKWQTEEEQSAKHTIETNGRGFNKSDGELLSAISEIINEGGDVLPDTWNKVQGMLLKYAKQLSLLLTEEQIES